MNFKIDTKEKFTVITPQIEDFTANMAEELANIVIDKSKITPHNVILNLKEVKTITNEAVAKLANCRVELYSANHSFVVCALQNALHKQVADWELDDSINYTPTESEAWDIVQMDEIEREFLAEE